MAIYVQMDWYGRLVKNARGKPSVREKIAPPPSYMLSNNLFIECFRLLTDIVAPDMPSIWVTL